MLKEKGDPVGRPFLCLALKKFSINLKISSTNITIFLTLEKKGSIFYIGWTDSN
jgi:hypothetical protein